VTVERGPAPSSTTRRIADAPERARVRLEGTVRAVTYPAAGSDPTFRVQVRDRSGEISLVFRGRTDIAGITPGRRLAVEGVVVPGRRPTLIDPQYELLPTDGDEP